MNDSDAIAGGGAFVGLTTLDIVHYLPSAPGRNEKALDESSLVASGGPATNAAITFAALGGRADLFSSVGRHPVASMVHGELERFGVTHHDLDPERTAQPTLASVLVSTDNGDRSIVASPVTKTSVPASTALASFSSDPAVLLVDGHDMRVAIAAAQLAKQSGIPVVLDGGSWKEGTFELLSHVDHAIVSERFHAPGVKDDNELFALLHDRGVAACAVTRGERDIRYSLDSGEQGHLQVPEVSAKDTLAAGDIFHGAHCYGVASLGLDFVGALQFGSSIASQSCRYLGPREWIEFHDSVVTPSDR